MTTTSCGFESAATMLPTRFAPAKVSGGKNCVRTTTRPTYARSIDVVGLLGWREGAVILIPDSA